MIKFLDFTNGNMVDKGNIFTNENSVGNVKFLEFNQWDQVSKDRILPMKI